MMEKVRCMLINANLISKVLPYAADYAVLLYNNLPHSALDKHKRPNGDNGDSSEFWKLYVFSTIWYSLQLSKVLLKLEDRSAKRLSLGIDAAGYNILDLQSKGAYVTKSMKVFGGNFLCTEQYQMHDSSEKRNRGNQALWNLRLQLLRIRATHLKSPVNKIYCQTSCKNASTSRAGTDRHSQKPWTRTVSFKDFQKQANLKRGWIQCEQNSQVWSITKLTLSSISLLEEK